MGDCRLVFQPVPPIPSEASLRVERSGEHGVEVPIEHREVDADPVRLVNPSWPPEGIDPAGLLLPTINTLVLMASGIAMIVAKRAIVRGNHLVTKLGQVVALALAVVFLVIKFIEYSGYDYNWATHAYGSITWTMTGFHTGHVISVLVKGLVVLAMSLRGMFRPDRHLALEISALYWVFVVVIWLPLYFTMYISPRL